MTIYRQITPYQINRVSWCVYVCFVDMLFDHVHFVVIISSTLINFDKQNLIVNTFVESNLEGNVYWSKNV